MIESSRPTNENPRNTPNVPPIFPIKYSLVSFESLMNTVTSGSSKLICTSETWSLIDVMLKKARFSLILAIFESDTYRFTRGPKWSKFLLNGCSWTLSEYLVNSHSCKHELLWQLLRWNSWLKHFAFSFTNRWILLICLAFSKYKHHAMCQKMIILQIRQNYQMIQGYLLYVFVYHSLWYS